MKKILITGAGGFIGSHLIELCLEQGYKTKAFVRYNSMNHWGWLEESACKDDIEIITGDVRDYDSIYKAMKGCDAVFHLAALIGIPYSYESPLAYVRTNIEGTYNILQAALKLKVSEVLITSTSETYGTAQYVPIDEKHPLAGQSPYSATKIGADQLALSFYRSFSLPVKIVRPFNTYGPRQSARAIIPTIITQIASGKEKIKLGNILPTRDLTYVNDIARGFLAIACAKELFGEVVNVGSNSEISIGDLAQLIASLMNKQIEIITDSQRIRPKVSEVQRLLCDNSKIRNATGWKPQYTLEQGLRETASWIEKHFNLYKSEVYNV